MSSGGERGPGGLRNYVQLWKCETNPCAAMRISACRERKNQVGSKDCHRLLPSLRLLAHLRTT
jgi:hypothetical protein